MISVSNGLTGCLNVFFGRLIDKYACLEQVLKSMLVLSLLGHGDFCMYQESGNLRDDVCCRNGCGQDFLDIYVPFDRTYFRKPVWVKSWNI